MLSDTSKSFDIVTDAGAGAESNGDDDTQRLAGDAHTDTRR
jgi:hypothetical protein